MDAYGIGVAMKGMAQVLIQVARQTGRTTALIESLKDGDRVVFTNMEEANRFKRLCQDRDLDVRCVVIPPHSPHRLTELGPPSKGRTIFDHTWVEHFYLNRIDSAAGEIDYWQRETSGYGEAHLETKRQVEEIMKWK